MSKTIENTLENKAKFFALYLNQHIVKWHKRNSHTPAYLHFSLLDVKNINKEYLELKSLSSISDEDAEYCIGKTECSMRKNDPNSGDYGMSPSSIFVNSMIGDSSYHIGRREADYLRSKGYAIKWMGKNVKEQILDGWVKLKGE